MIAFLRELKRRNVFKVGAAYAVLAWLIIQVASTLFPALNLPEWAVTLAAALILLGFPFALLLAWAYEITPDGIKRSDDVAVDASTTPATGQRLNYVITGLLVVAVGFLIIDRYWPASETSTGDDSTGGASGVVSAPASRAQPAIAVLNFVNGSSDPEQDYFVDGLSEQLRDTLGRIRGLAVVGSTSSTYFEGREADLRTIGEALGVGHVLEGSIRKSGDALRISARLTHVESGYQRWSDTYERTVDDIFVMQDQIASAVAEALQITLGVGAIGRLAGMTRDVAAYEEFVTALGLFRDFRPESMRRAIDHAERAIELDPAFSIGWLTLRDLYQYRSGQPEQPGEGQPGDTDAWTRRSIEALERAVALTPNAPRVLLAQAQFALANGDFATAGRFFEEQLPALAAEFEHRAVASSATGRFMFAVGRIDDAIREFEEARADEPLAGQVAAYLADSYAAVGAFEAAFAEYDRGREIGDFSAFLNGAALIAALGSRDRTEIDRQLGLGRVVNDNVNFQIAPLLDEPARALALIRSVTTETPPSAVPLLHYIAAMWAAYFGDAEESLRLLREVAALDGQSENVTTVIWRPVMRDVRRLPAFNELVEEIGLVDYWREHGWPDLCRPILDRDFACE